MKAKILLSVVILFLVHAGCNGGTDFSSEFSEYGNGCITIFDTKDGSTIRFREELCGQEFLPASTFKILNAMIGLETGVITGPDHIKKWDGRKRAIQSWNRDHDLRSAISNSVVWYFEDLANKVGPERMSKWVKACGYGNGYISGEQPFWLAGDLGISTDGQVDFLRRLHNRELPFSMKTMDTVVGLLLLKQDDGFKLYGKTGWAQRDGVNIGWFVGWIEQGERIVFFATNLQSRKTEGFSEARKSITLDCLQRVGIDSAMLILDP